MTFFSVEFRYNNRPIMYQISSNHKIWGPSVSYFASKLDQRKDLVVTLKALFDG